MMQKLAPDPTEIRTDHDPFADYCRKRGLSSSENLDPTWRNAVCDVKSMWSHIWYKGDIFVTSDGNFLRSKKDPLIGLGAKAILRAEEAVTATT